MDACLGTCPSDVNTRFGH